MYYPPHDRPQRDAGQAPISTPADVAGVRLVDDRRRRHDALAAALERRGYRVTTDPAGPGWQRVTATIAEEVARG